MRLTDYERGLVAYSLVYTGLFSGRKPKSSASALAEARLTARKLGLGDEFEEVLARGLAGAVEAINDGA